MLFFSSQVADFCTILLSFILSGDEPVAPATTKPLETGNLSCYIVHFPASELCLSPVAAVTNTTNLVAPNNRHCLPVLEARSLKSVPLHQNQGVGRAIFPLEALRTSSLFFWLLVAAGLPWLVATRIQSLLLVATLFSPLLSLISPLPPSCKDTRDGTWGPSTWRWENYYLKIINETPSAEMLFPYKVTFQFPRIRSLIPLGTNI